MMLQRIVLLAVMVICVVDLAKSRRASFQYPGSVRVALVVDGPSHDVEGFVRYLYWEIAVRNRRTAEITVRTLDPAGEPARVARLLEDDGLVVGDASGGSALVFRI